MKDYSGDKLNATRIPLFSGAGSSSLEDSKWMIEPVVIVTPVAVDPFFHSINNFIQT